MPDGTAKTESWDFAGWGNAERITDIDTSDLEEKYKSKPKKHKLGQWGATAICGNDITSSCLYVSALCATQAGAYAPLALFVVAVILYLFRKVYAEVGSALPLNGGTYTVLLNTTNKKWAATAAVLTLLSYVATAVISAVEASHYGHNLWSGLPILLGAGTLLGIFAILNIIGVAESAIVAIFIFVLHILTLTILVVTGGYMVLKDSSMLSLNFATPAPGGIAKALFFGFAAAMLGISGFESSANFIEEQEKGVFPKTLRNMWIAVAIFNPLISLLALGLLPLVDVQGAVKTGDLLAQMGDISVGAWLKVWVSIDAVLVLSGAVLTSYVGVTGLMRRMSLDRCLPQGLLATNKARNTNHWIILSFFLVCCSILAMTLGDVESLAVVYTLSFLSVMSLFAIGNMLLKVERARLPRETKAGWGTVMVAFAAVLTGLVGNVLMKAESVAMFFIYFLCAATVVAIMFMRIQIMKALLHTVRSMIAPLRKMIEEINSRSVIYFAKGSDPAELNRAALYVLENEQTTHMKVVYVFDDEKNIPPEFAEHLATIDKLYPQLRIDFVAVKGNFGPALIEVLSERFQVPRNYMFIGTPGDRFPHRIDDLGGVRLIL